MTTNRHRRQQSTALNDAGGSRRWRALRDQVVREEPTCRVRFDAGCTVISRTADHIIPRAVRPDLVMVRANLRGSCVHCNLARGRKTVRPQPAVIAPQQKRAAALAFFD